MEYLLVVVIIQNVTIQNNLYLAITMIMRKSQREALSPTNLRTKNE